MLRNIILLHCREKRFQDYLPRKISWFNQTGRLREKKGYEQFPLKPLSGSVLWYSCNTFFVRVITLQSYSFTLAKIM